eukprot:TRINITY_DN4361_c1_g1_i1.p1 TRINITY_DN4361_c1_g1~~TRINITY_DN4361_c1_g1_i1.p1  ORF type:complete len:387 (+),score=87.12 TRINITY_DN4361_c1_g1_i1:73-1233(+)
MVQITSVPPGVSCVRMPPRKSQGDQEQTVTTPWYPEGIEKKELRLENEVKAFGDFLQLTEDEEIARKQVIEIVKERGLEVFGPDCVATVFGSYGAGTCCPDSNVNVALEACGKLNKTKLIDLGSVGEITSLFCNNYKSALLNVNIDGVPVSINLASTYTGEPKTTVEATKRWVADFPQAVYTHRVLRQVLLQTNNLGDASTGAINSYSLLCMVIALCRDYSHITKPSELLVTFARVYGKEFDFTKFSIDPESGLSTPTRHPEDVMSILEPLGTNAGAGCSRLYFIKAQLQHCCAALTRWETPGKRGYSGRSPLSSILSHQRLWVRVRELQQKEAGQSTPQSLPSSSSDVNDETLTIQTLSDSPIDFHRDISLIDIALAQDLELTLP